MAEPQWHVSVNGKQRGPFPLDRLKKAAESGGLPDDALVKRDGWDDWKPWREIPILYAQPQTLAPQLSPGAAPVSAESPRPSAPPAAALPHAFPYSPAPGSGVFTSKSTRRNGSGLLGYLTFRQMVTPVVILVVYWIGVAAIALYGLISLLTAGLAVVQNGTGGGAALGLVMFATALILLPAGIIMWRVYCEIIAVFFRIYETLVEISEKLDRPRD